MPATTTKLAHLTLDELDALALHRLATVRREADRDPRYGWDLPWSGLMTKMRLLTPQAYGVRIERYMAHRHGWESVSSTIDRGDVVDAAGHWEIKVSLVDMDDVRRHAGRANFLQVRQHQDIAGYHLFVIGVDDRVTHFQLTKDQMHVELETLGSLAHGTQAAAGTNARVERAIRLRPGDERWQQWVADYGCRACAGCPK